MESPKVHKILYGGDYNPEQWPEEVWQEDMHLLPKAHIDTVTINVFSWAKLQPSEEEYDFSELDKIMEMLKKNHFKVCLATSTAAHPAWMAKRYPDILRVDFEGRKRKFGMRHNSCPNSPTYKKYSVKLAGELAKRYKDFDHIVAWHISNEYGGECYCDNCGNAFRGWLKEKYKTIDNVNKAWNTSFWGHTFYDWDEIVPPNSLSEHFGYNRTTFQGISLDYARFNSDSLLECYKDEYKVIKEITPHIPITTNLMGLYKPLDYQKWAPYLDFISWDNYPSNDDPYSRTAMSHDLMRGLKQGMPFALMEQTPSVTNWLPYNALKRPGVIRLWSYQAVAHGADTVMFFQMRRSIGACEKYHGAVIDHAGHENTRVFRECAELGQELELLGDKLLGSRVKSDIAILFDWNNWWAIEYSAGPSADLKYQSQIHHYYQALFNENYNVDLISVNDDFDQYKLIIAPALYMVKEGVDQKLEKFVKNGGTFLTTFFSGYVDEHDLVQVGGYPGKLSELLGIWVEETDALPVDQWNEIIEQEQSYSCNLLFDIIHLKGAEAIASYGKDFYAGTPVVTKNTFGQGAAWYVGSNPEERYLSKLLKTICHDAGIKPILPASEGIEVSRRVKGESQYTFILNHNDLPKKLVLEQPYRNLLNNKEYANGEEIVLSPKDVLILENL
ncbi:beta-galactosidase [Neobacillus drentensis]|uniref:beta-galactosidase n=1 Tax=Neobacillus drentensis TaxID=220684 RepID=UPI003D2F63DE